MRDVLRNIAQRKSKQKAGTQILSYHILLPMLNLNSL